MSDSLRLHDCSPPGSSVHGILQTRMLEWVAISFSRGASQPRDRSLVSHIAGSLLHCRQILHWHQGSRFVIAGKHNGLPQGDSPSCPPLKDSKEVNGEGNGSPLQHSCLENPMDGGAWWAAVHGVTKSRTRLSDFPFPFHFHALEKEMAAHSSVLAWRIPGTAEPGGLQSMGSHRVGRD